MHQGTRDLYVVCKDSTVEKPINSLMQGSRASVQVGDIIKLGRIKFKITEVQLETDQNTNDQDVPLNTDERGGDIQNAVGVEDVGLEF